jgi:hypothetical protein
MRWSDNNDEHACHEERCYGDASHKEQLEEAQLWVLHHGFHRIRRSLQRRSICILAFVDDLEKTRILLQILVDVVGVSLEMICNAEQFLLDLFVQKLLISGSARPVSSYSWWWSQLVEVIGF